jgi:5-methylthioadenosine/S-adenosylhomocysteine deaminase
MSDELLIENALLWPSAGAKPVRGSILAAGGRIRRIGRFSARAKVAVDAEGLVAMPGLIQAHVHLCQTLFRGLAEDLPLLPWLRRFIWPLEAAHDTQSVRASALLACAEMIRGGTTAFLSMETVRHTQAAFEAVEASGLVGTIGHCFMDETCGTPSLSTGIEDSLSQCDALAARWKGHQRLRLAVAPRFALACSQANMRRAADYARGKGLRLHTHASEQQEEIALVRERTGLSNIEYLHTVGLTGPDVGLAHCVHTTPRERDLLRSTGTHVLHCPSANLKLGSGIAPVPEYLGSGINVGIGADGAPCNNRLDAFLEMREAALIQKVRLGPEALRARDIVRMATEGGAAALGLAEEMGTLDAGKLANIILVDQRGLHATPSEDLATNLVYSCSAADVAMTIVHGRILYAHGKLTTIDEAALKKLVLRERRRLVKRAGLG